MARILVAGTTESLGGRDLAERVAARVRADGHDAALLGATPLPEVREADAVVCLLDGPVPPPAAVAAAATAHALGKPALALHTHPLGDAMATLFTQSAGVHDESDLAGPLAAFYAHVRPFAGRLVRDQVPRLVREAGHAVRFREAAPDERPRYLKRKLVEEAQELLEAGDPGEEREEAADLLEALEALLVARGISREDLRLVKEGKRRRRGGFERGFVVESAGAGEAAETVEPTDEPRNPGIRGSGFPGFLDSAVGPSGPAAVQDDAPLSFSAMRAAAATPQPPSPPAAPSRRAALWNVGARGEREAIPDPGPEDPEHIEPAVRDV